jgi:hypothetical protein
MDHRINLHDRISKNQGKPKSIENPLNKGYRNKISGNLRVKTNRLPVSSRRDQVNRQKGEYGRMDFENLHSIDCRERTRVKVPFKRKTPKKSILKKNTPSKALKTPRRKIEPPSSPRNVLEFDFAQSSNQK